MTQAENIITGEQLMAVDSLPGDSAIQILSAGVPAAEDVFGSASVLSDGLPVMDFAQPFEWLLTGNPFFSLALIICFCIYCLLLYNFRVQAIALVNMFRGQLYVEKLLDEQNFTFETFLRSAISLGIVLSGMTIVKIFDMYIGADIASELPHWLIPALPVGLWLILLAVLVVQHMGLKVVGWLSLSQEFISDVNSLRKLVVGLAFLYIIPIMMLFVLAGHQAAVVILIILAIATAVFFIFLLFRTYALFMQQKISILYWFLYLCTVEIFPISFLVLLALKNI